MLITSSFLHDSDNVPQGFEVKMVGGRYPWEGHLKIRESGGQWGAICSDEWTLKEAIVACRETGGELYGLAKTALKVSSNSNSYSTDQIWA